MNPMTIVAGVSAPIDRFGGRGQDGQTSGTHNLLLAAQKMNILTCPHKVCVQDIRSTDTVPRTRCKC